MGYNSILCIKSQDNRLHPSAKWVFLWKLWSYSGRPRLSLEALEALEALE
jgi:hypothetical protein